MKIAVIGCGALTHTFYLPVMKQMGITPFVLVDPNLESARKLAEKYGVTKVAATLEEIADEIDAGIIASPNFLHVEQSLALLQGGKHVLVEKPMATTEQDGRRLIAAAAKNKAVLQVGMMRRFWKVNIAVKKLLEEKVLGDLQHVTMQEGGILSWPVQSLAIYDPKLSSGGVLMDTGAHTVDLLMWWLNDGPYELEYFDDNKGGVETDCELKLNFYTQKCPVLIRLSRIRKMPNEFVLEGSQGWIKVKAFGNRFEASSSGIQKAVTSIYSAEELKRQTIEQLFGEQLTTWIASCTQNKPVAVPAESVLPSIRVIEKAYQLRKELIFPF